MNFTREPIIETIITPKEGNKLIIKNSKGGSHEEYEVDAVEVVSFGHSFFYRSLERAKSFLLPVTDYEIVETKETRVAIKSAAFDRSIKIGGGREASLKVAREPTWEKTSEPSVASEQSLPSEAPFQGEQRIDKKRERRRHRRRRAQEERSEVKEAVVKAEEAPVEASISVEETQVAAPVFSRLFPPPPTLISEKLGKTKERMEKEIVSEPLEEPRSKKIKSKEDFIEEIEISADQTEFEGKDTSESSDLHRVISNNSAAGPFDNTTYSTPKSSWMDFFTSRNPFKH